MEQQCDLSVVIFEESTPCFPGHHAFVGDGCIIQAVAGDSRGGRSATGDQWQAGDIVDAQSASFGDLTSLAVRGHPAAVAALLERIRPMVVRYCRARLGRITGHYYVADDVAQEVCLAVLSTLPRYRDMGRPFASPMASMTVP